MAVVIALDAGTTSVRALAIDESGEELGSAQLEFRQHFPQPGLLEHDPEDIWTAASATLMDLTKHLNSNGVPITALGITNQRETVVAWDAATGLARHRAIVWQDRRTAERCRELEAAGHAELVRTRTGLVLDPYFSASKIEWMLAKPGRLVVKGWFRLGFGILLIVLGLTVFGIPDAAAN